MASTTRHEWLAIGRCIEPGSKSPKVVAAWIAIVGGLLLSVDRGSVSAEFDPPSTSNWVAVDCNLTAPGVQDTCTAILGQSLDVGIVAGNVTGVGTPGPQQPAAFNFHLENSNANVLAPESPEPPACAGASLDCNPDFNQVELSGGWTCEYVTPLSDEDIDSDPATSQSRLVCFNGFVDGRALGLGGSVLLATVHFNGSTLGTTGLSLQNVAVGNAQASSLASCAPDVDGTNAVCGTASVTVLAAGADGDLDGLSNLVDNCPLASNAAQANGDSGPEPPTGNIGAIGNGTFLPGDDDTIPGGDTLGDACDDDRDNDGLPNVSDPVSGLPRDLTVDDDGDGLAALGCFGGTDLDDDGVSWDTNCDGKLDGAPADCGSGNEDADGDGLLDAWETCRWGTSNSLPDSDADDLSDCIEAFDLNGNEVVTNADAVFIRQAVFSVNPRDWAFDMNGNGILTNADAIFITQSLFDVIDCLELA